MGAVSAPVTVVGIGADGLASVGACARERIERADVLLGGERHLALVPSRHGQERRSWPRPLSALPGVVDDARTRGRVVVLASGDPLVSGIGTTLVGLLGSDAVEVLPAVSSVSLARARMGWSAEESEVVTLVGRDVAGLRRHLADGRRLLVLSSDERTPAAVARLLVDAGHAPTRMVVLGDLGAPEESRTDTTAVDLLCLDPEARTALPRLHVLALEVAGADADHTSWAPGLPDHAYDSDGQLSRRDVRAGALARLAPRPGHLLWDVGAGAGSVGIEWLRAHPTTAAVAIESDPERAARIARNARALGVPRLQVVEGRAPGALAGLPDPDAVFIGGGATEPGLLEACRAALRSGGRLVVHGVTHQTEALLIEAHERLGGELTRISVEQAGPIGARFTGWTPARAVVSWSWTAPARPSGDLR